MANRNIENLQIENFDPLGKLLREKFKFSPLSFGIFMLLLNIIVDGYIGIRYDILIVDNFPPPPPGILQDFMAIVSDFVYLPIISALYIWAPQGATRVFQQLLDSRIFTDAADYERVIDNSRSTYAKKKVFFIILVTATLFAISQYGAYFEWFPWKTVGGYIDGLPTASNYRFIFWVLMVYFLSYSIFNVGATIGTLRKLFRATEIQILPMHPDKCGGLGGISKYTTVIGFGIGTVGLLISAATIYELVLGNFEIAIPVIIGIGSYLIFAPIFFFLPLGTAHETMRKAKDDELLGIAQRFANAYNELKITPEEAEDYEKKLSKLDNIKKLYSVADSFPIWPFDIQSLRRFLAIITTPVLPAVFTIVVNYISSFF